MSQLIELHYDEGDKTARYRATLTDSALSALEGGLSHWIPVSSLERWNEQEGVCIVVEPGTGVRREDLRLRSDRIVSFCAVERSAVESEAARSPYSPSLRRKLELFFERPLAEAVLLSESASSTDLVNYDVAIDHLAVQHASEHERFGYAKNESVDQHKPLGSVLAEQGPESKIALQPIQRVQLPVGPDESRLCMTEGVHLLVTDFGRFALSLSKPFMKMDDSITFEVLASTEETALRALEEVRSARDQLNVFRGQTISIARGGLGGMRVDFASISYPERDDVVLGGGVMELIERQAMGPRDHRERLLREGFTTRRGLLLHGPPGTGKTLTVRYLLGRFSDHTRVMLTGDALECLKDAYAIARSLVPSVVVLEDVDLVGGDRESNRFAPVLHSLLDALDGLERQDDITTVLTTNRPELLEEALAQRPGRVDQAVEIGLPGPAERRLLLERFSRDMKLDADLGGYVRSTQGATGAFIEEFLRRAVIVGAQEGAQAVTSHHLDAALAELTASGDTMTREIVGFSAPEGLGA